MSTRKVAHQNKTAFTHQKNSKKSKKIASLPNEGLCLRCFEIIEWRKRYHKYKTLTAPTVCTQCKQHNVFRAYHIYCVDCVREKKVCAKCGQTKELVTPIVTDREKVQRQMEIDEILFDMSLREKRSFYRKLEQEEAEQKRILECKLNHIDPNEAKRIEEEQEERKRLKNKLRKENGVINEEGEIVENSEEEEIEENEDENDGKNEDGDEGEIEENDDEEEEGEGDDDDDDDEENDQSTDEQKEKELAAARKEKKEGHKTIISDSWDDL